MLILSPILLGIHLLDPLERDRRERRGALDIGRQVLAELLEAGGADDG